MIEPWSRRRRLIGRGFHLYRPHPLRQMHIVSVPLSSTRTSSFFHDVLTRDTFLVQPARLRYSSQHLHFYFGGIGRIGPGLDLGAFNEQCMSGLHITGYSIHCTSLSSSSGTVSIHFLGNNRYPSLALLFWRETAL
jgi:hypothetical protein